MWYARINIQALQGLCMRLDKVRDWGGNSFTWFWRDAQDKIVSPYFDTKTQAEQWLQNSVENKFKNIA